MKRTVLTQENEQDIINKYVVEEMSLLQISRIYKIKREKIKKILAKNNISVRSRYFYAEVRLSIDKEKEIINDYLNNKIGLAKLSKKYSMCIPVIYRVLNNNKIDIRKRGEYNKKVFSSQEIETARNIYNETGSLNLVAKFFKVKPNVIKVEFNKNNIPYELGAKSNVSLEKWAVLFGKEKADEMWQAYIEQGRKRNIGSRNPMFGKSSPNGSGQGWKGWYKNNFFRSLRELSYMLYLDENCISWESAEQKRFRIPYTDWNQVDRTYAPDFFINGNTLIEVKPERLHLSPLVKLKINAAESFCKINNLNYRIIDYPINLDKIKDSLQKGDVIFDRDYKGKFLKYLLDKNIL